MPPIKKVTEIVWDPSLSEHYRPIILSANKLGFQLKAFGGVAPDLEVDPDYMGHSEIVLEYKDTFMPWGIENQIKIPQTPEDPFSIEVIRSGNNRVIILTH